MKKEACLLVGGFVGAYIGFYYQQKYYEELRVERIIKERVAAQERIDKT